MNHGISILQGPHQVAQKSSSTTLPLKSDNFTVLPWASFKAKSGATLRSLSSFTAAFTDLCGAQAVTPSATATVAARVQRRMAMEGITSPKYRRLRQFSLFHRTRDLFSAIAAGTVSFRTLPTLFVIPQDSDLVTNLRRDDTLK